MMKSIFVASVVSLGLASAAYALPGHIASPGAAASIDTLQVKKDWKKGDWKHDDWKKGDWKRHNKHRYGYGNDHPPYGWRSYHYRPYGWATRGCIAIGPLWYCP
jgi:hypothetical protein